MKNPTPYFYLFFILFSVYSCSKEDGSVQTDYPDGISLNPETQAPVVHENLVQFTPDQADWSTFYSKPLEEGFLTHDPDGWTAAKVQALKDATWDGTIYDPTKMSKKEFYDCICPNPDVVRGIRDLFYETKPFKDNAKPTKAEVDEWHRISIRHLRNLVGYDYPIKKDSTMFIRALWSQQRKFSTIWDEKYGTPGETKGGIHYGAGFIPDAEDQWPYLAEGANLIQNRGSQSEGVFVRPRAHIPWSVKWIRPFCFSLSREGFWGGHLGPFWRREKFGFSFWDLRGTERSKSYTNLRAKWSGAVYPHLYEKPN